MRLFLSIYCNLRNEWNVSQDSVQISLRKYVCGRQEKGRKWMFFSTRRNLSPTSESILMSELRIYETANNFKMISSHSSRLEHVACRVIQTTFVWKHLSKRQAGNRLTILCANLSSGPSMLKLSHFLNQSSK